MSHPLEIQAKTKMVDERAKQVFLKIKQDYHQETIRSHTEYLYRISKGLEDFFKGIGKPTYLYRPAWGPPFSQDYNNMMQEIDADVMTLHQEMNLLIDGLNESFHYIDTDRTYLQYRMKKIEDELKNVEIKMNQASEEIAFRDTFITQDYFEQERTGEIPAHAWTKEGVLTIQPLVQETFTEKASIRILEGNGLPGNTKQVRSISGELQFIGEDSLHIELAEILDSNQDTWFEYEAFDVSDRVKAETAYQGYEFSEGISWVNKPGEDLKLAMEITLPSPTTINWFSLSPFVPNDKGANPALVRSIEIHDGKGNTTQLLKSALDVFNEEKIYLFSSQVLCKRIVVLLEQPISYETEIGHLYYKQLETTETNFLNRLRTEKGRRIEGPLPSIEELGFIYDSETREIIQPSASYGISSLHSKPEKVKDALFTAPPVEEENVQSGFEMIPAWRYVIGIRDVGISYFQYMEKSEYVSVPFQTDREIQGVYLTAEQFIPEQFGEGDWLRYEISVNDNNIWYPIHPRGIPKAKSKILYLFRTNTPNEGRIEQFGYIDNVEPVYQVRLRIRLSRPTNIVNSRFYSPILKEYTLHAITKGV